MTDVEHEIRRSIFRRLLRTQSAVSVSELAGEVHRPLDEVVDRVAAAARQGQLRLNGQGRVFGAAGLSVEPDRHEIEVDGRRFWTWCAYDILGIFGALRATGVARSVSPDSGAALQVHFEAGHPLATPLVLFRPDEDRRACCSNVYEQWCPNSNFFESAEAATRWSAARGIEGHVLSLPEATGHAASDWEPLVEEMRAGKENLR